MRWIYLSPHLDDAVLSAGGLIYEKVHAGKRVEIWTIVCGFPPPGELTPFAQYLHARWGTTTAEATVRLRRDEDSRAAGMLGAKTLHFDVPDCIYRRGPGGEALYEDVFIEPHPLESNLPATIASTLSERLMPQDRVVCQFAIGNHVDHILVRRTAESLNRPLWYAADLPYHFKQPGELAKQISGMKAVRRPITEAGLKAWIEAILAYRSQLSTVFDDLDLIEPEIRKFIAEWGGFPLWRPL
jgi:LmbE family N-acetylglucosaminyl deacetylase